MASVTCLVFCRANAITLKPEAASLRAMPSPRPRLAPVTRTVRAAALAMAAFIMAARQFSGRSDIERWNERNSSWHFVARQGRTAVRQNVGVDLCFRAGSHAFALQYHIGDHDRAGHGILPRAHQRHPHLRMAIDDGLDFLGVNFLAADIDDAAFAAGESVTVAV